MEACHEVARHPWCKQEDALSRAVPPDVSRHVHEARMRRKPASMDGLVLKLFITGGNPGHGRVVQGLRGLCERHFCGEYYLEIIDVSLDPERAEREHILATPTLVKAAPGPVQRVIGDFTSGERVLVQLGLSEPAAEN